MDEEMSRFISPEAGKFVDQVFALNDSEEIRELIQNAGFSNISVEVKNKMFSLPAPKDFLWQYVQSTPLAGILAEADEEARAALEKAVVDQWQEFMDGSAFMYEQRMVSVIARK